jgi:hypothetical protein
MRSVETSTEKSAVLSEVSLGLFETVHGDGGILPRLSDDPFLPNAFQLIIHQSFYHSTL